MTVTVAINPVYHDTMHILVYRWKFKLLAKQVANTHEANNGH